MLQCSHFCLDSSLIELYNVSSWDFKENVLSKITSKFSLFSFNLHHFGAAQNNIDTNLQDWYLYYFDISYIVVGNTDLTKLCIIGPDDHSATQIFGCIGFGFKHHSASLLKGSPVGYVASL